MYLYDTHFHLDLYNDAENLVLQIEKAKIYAIAVTNSPTVFFHTQKLVSNSRYIRAALGLHPELAAQRKNELGQFEQLINETKYIGEIGLDNQGKTPSDYSIQKQVFEKILTLCADKKDKILTIHSRKATSDVLSMIGKQYSGKIILHWYSGGMKDLEIALENGFYFSVNYPMTTSETGKKIIERLPIDRILIETDGPFTKLNSDPFTPLMSKVISDRIFLLKNGNYNEVAKDNTLFDNFKKLIS